MATGIDDDWVRNIVSQSVVVKGLRSFTAFFKHAVLGPSTESQDELLVKAINPGLKVMEATVHHRRGIFQQELSFLRAQQITGELVPAVESGRDLSGLFRDHVFGRFLRRHELVTTKEQQNDVENGLYIMSIEVFGRLSILVIDEEFIRHVGQSSGTLGRGSAISISEGGQVEVVENAANMTVAGSAPHDIPWTNVPVDDPRVIIQPFMNYGDNQISQ